MQELVCFFKNRIERIDCVKPEEKKVHELNNKSESSMKGRVMQYIPFQKTLPCFLKYTVKTHQCSQHTEKSITLLKLKKIMSRYHI